MKTAKKYLTKKSDDLSRWYGEIIEKAQLADYSPVKGCMVIRPNGFAIWEKVQNIIDAWFKRDSVKNAYFPLLIPLSLLEREKKHVAGFSPELAVVTIGGGEKLKEPLVIRPTSETIMYNMFSNWISSYKDLPLKINQWCNVVRWEKRTYPFLRTTEFLWQEGHTVHISESEAMEMVIRALNWYKDFYEKILGISVYVGEKSASERFAGAKRTFSIELVISNGKALQGATSHYLGQTFAKAFEIKYLDAKNQLKYPYQTSWGISTRAIGGLILSHGDDNGLVLPPKIAPYQLIIIMIAGKNTLENKKVEHFIDKIESILAKAVVAYRVDNDTNKSLGYRINQSEIMGIPIRVEVGPAEVESGTVIVSRRDNLTKDKISLEKLDNYLSAAINSMQDSIFLQSQDQKESLTVEVADFNQFKKIMETERKFIRAFWCESTVCETKIKEYTKATTRVVELSEINKAADGSCVYCSNKARRKWLFAQAY